MSAPSTAHQIEYATYSDLGGIAGISAEWDGLLAVSTCNRAFASPEWYAASCRARAACYPWVVTASRGGEIVGILPLAVDPEENAARFPHFISDYNDIIACAGDSAIVADLLDYAASAGVCKRIVLSRLRPDSNCVRALPLLTAKRNVRCEFREIDWHYRIGLPSSFDGYLASRSKAFRTNAKQALRRMEAGILTMRELLPANFDPDCLAEVFRTMACARQGQKSFFKRADADEFVRQVLPAVFKKRGLIVFGIFQGERAVGLYVHIVGGRSLGAWNGGFLPEVGRWSPGTLLLAHGIKRAIDLRLPEYDFLEGKELYKKHWTDDRYPIYEVEFVSEA